MLYFVEILCVFMVVVVLLMVVEWYDFMLYLYFVMVLLCVFFGGDS